MTKPKLKRIINERTANTVFDQYDDARGLISIVYDGRILVTQDFITTLFNTKKSNIRMWVGKGLAKSELSGHSTPLYDLLYLLEWHKKNIATKRGARSKSPIADQDDIPYDGLELLSEADRTAFLSSDKDPLDKIKVMTDIEQARIKRDKERGKLVEKDEVALAIAEYTGMYISQLKADLKILPIELQDKTPEEISDFLEPHTRSTLEILTEVFEGKTKEEPTITQILEALGILIRDVGVDGVVEMLQKAKKNKKG